MCTAYVAMHVIKQNEVCKYSLNMYALSTVNGKSYGGYVRADMKQDDILCNMK